MTSRTTPPHAQQPDLRSFIVCDRLPDGCVAHVVQNDHNWPHLRAGDIAIVNPDDREPQPGELFVIEWSSGSRAVVEAWLQSGFYDRTPTGEMVESDCWMVGPCNRPKTPKQIVERLAKGTRGGVFCSGPYESEGPHAGYLKEKFVGKIVGLLDATFSEPVRIAA